MIDSVVRDERDQIVGFVFGLSDEDAGYHNLYGGIDDDRRGADADLYFNLQYQDLDRALRHGAKTIHFGQTADEFKARLGAIPQPLFFYARAVNPVLNASLRVAKSLVFPPVPKVPARDVFKADPPLRPTGRRAVRGGNAPAPSGGNTADTGDT